MPNIAKKLSKIDVELIQHTSGVREIRWLDWKDGKDWEKPSVDELVDIIIPLIPKPLPWKKWEPWPRWKDGKNGKDGKDWINGKDGKDGKDLKFSDLTPYQMQVLTWPPWNPWEWVPRGGTTGQILAKKANGNFQTEWIDNTWGAGISDWDKWDITVSGSGATWTIDNAVVTNAKMADMATKTYKGRTSALTGVPEDVAVATLKADLSLAKTDVWLGNVDNTSDATKNSATATLTNKRITKRVVTTTDDATAVIDVDVTDVYQLSAVANATTFTLTGTPTDWQTILIRFKDAWVAKALTWTGFTAIGVTLPTTTVAGKWHYVWIQYNSAATAWHAIAVSVEA